MSGAWGGEGVIRQMMEAVSELETRMTATEAAISSLSTVAGTATKSVTKLRTVIEVGLQAQAEYYAGLESKVTSDAEHIAALEARVAALEAAKKQAGYQAHPSGIGPHFSKQYSRSAKQRSQSER